MPTGFGIATATFVVVASMVGVGVLTTSGFTVFFVGSNQLMLVLWVLGALFAVCGALTRPHSAWGAPTWAVPPPRCSVNSRSMIYVVRRTFGAAPR